MLTTSQVRVCCSLFPTSDKERHGGCAAFIGITTSFSNIFTSIINLCTLRHLNFRMKLSTTTFYAALAQSYIEEASAVLAYTENNYKKLVQREAMQEIEQPPDTTDKFQKCGVDIAVMKAILLFWTDPDSFDISAAKQGFDATTGKHSELNTTHRKFCDLFQCEIVKVHLLTSGNRSEAYVKRTQAVLRIVTECMKTYPADSADSASASEESEEDKERAFLQLFEVSVLTFFEFLEMDYEGGEDTVTIELREDAGVRQHDALRIFIINDALRIFVIRGNHQKGAWRV